jgi:glycosyltransferase involved in cell wall biosynthesis
MKIVIAGTHSSQKTGYARVMKGLVPRLVRSGTVKVYGAQSCGPSEFADGVEFDAYEAEKLSDPDGNGFHFGGFREFVERCAPDAVILYNDPVVIAGYLGALEGAKIRVYLYVDFVNSRISERHWPTFRHPLVAGVMVMSECWKRELLGIPGFSKPVIVATHAVDVPIVPNARISGCGDDVVFLNMNRNTKRKRLDVYAAAAARFLARNPEAPARFLANSHHEQAFDLHSIAIREMVACGVPADRIPALASRIMINRSVLSDEVVNFLHNACDVAVNCSEGEGFGLCAAEAASVGKPVIVSGVGGALDLFAPASPTAPAPAWIVPPVAEYFVDGRDGIGGCAELISVDDLASAFSAFMLAENRKMFGERARVHMASRPSWDDVAESVLSFVAHAK